MFRGLIIFFFATLVLGLGVMFALKSAIQLDSVSVIDHKRPRPEKHESVFLFPDGSERSTTTQSPCQAIMTHVDTLRQQGIDVVHKITPSFGIAITQAEDNDAGLLLVHKQGGSEHPTILNIPSVKEFRKTLTPDPVTGDVVGKDIPGIPRFPRSTREFYSNCNEQEGSTIAVYHVAASPESAFSFYETRLNENGWHLALSEFEDDSLSRGGLLMCQDRGRVCTIGFKLNARKGGTDITMLCMLEGE